MFSARYWLHLFGYDMEAAVCIHRIPCLNDLSLGYKKMILNENHFHPTKASPIDTRSKLEDKEYLI